MTCLPQAKQPRLDRSFYQQKPVRLAKALLGQRLVRLINGQRLAGLIVETEAYLGQQDQAAHTFKGRKTERNASMWQDGGHTYVYFTYGMHYCSNVVAGQAGQPVAVLLRALEPVEGFELMRQHRIKARRDRDLCAGPARLCQALRIDRQLDGEDLVTSDRLWIEQVRRRCLPADRIVTTTRVGVDYAGEWAEKPLRFYIAEHPCVSRR